MSYVISCTNENGERKFICNGEGGYPFLSDNYKCGEFYSRT